MKRRGWRPDAQTKSYFDHSTELCEYIFGALVENTPDDYQIRHILTTQLISEKATSHKKYLREELDREPNHIVSPAFLRRDGLRRNRIGGATRSSAHEPFCGIDNDRCFGDPIADSTIGVDSERKCRHGGGG